MRTDLLDRLAKGPILGDGGYVLELERRVLGSYKTHIPMAVLDYPEGLLELHREFARAGSDVLQAMTWGVMEFDREAELNRTAVELARKAAGPDRFVAGTLTAPAGGTADLRYGAKLTNADRLAAERFYARRVDQQMAEGVDLFMLESAYSLELALPAIRPIKEAGVPAVILLTFRESPFTLDNFSPGEAARRLVDAGADVVGINCNRPFQTMMPLIREMRQAVSVPLCSQPVAYQLEPGELSCTALINPGLWGRAEPRLLTRFAFSEYALEALRVGVAFIGACCGTLPYHIRAMAETLGRPTELPDIDRGYQMSSELRARSRKRGI
jgi:betaine-homocysteine S-methyltransferase